MANRIIKIIFGIITIACFFYIGRLIIRLDIDWGIILETRTLIFFLPSLIIAISTLFLSSYVYRKNMELLSGKLYPSEIINWIYLKANIGKYLPGNVFHFAGRNVLGQRFNIEQSVLLGSTVLAHMQTITLSLLLPLILDISIYSGVLTLLRDLLGQQYFYVIGAVILGILVLLVIFRSYIDKQLKKFREYVRNVEARKVIPNFILMGIYLVLYGISFCIIAFAISGNGLSFSIIITTILSFIFAWLCGLVVIGAPGGMGIREVVLLFLLGNLFSDADLITIIVIHRLCTIIADIIGFVYISIKEKLHGVGEWEKVN